MHKIKSILFLLLMILLVYTRFTGLDWGQPYPMHPDERNMVNALQQLSCDWPAVASKGFSIKTCFNPNFFAYGQFPLYLGYGIVSLLKFMDGDLLTPISHQEATFSLRIISALSSVINFFVLLKIVQLILERYSLFNKSKDDKSKDFLRALVWYLIPGLIFILSPFFIQFSHFGTTESLLMLLYSSIVYLSIKFWLNKLSGSFFYLLTAIVAGLAIATKVSSIVFLLIPVAVELDKERGNLIKKILSVSYMLSLTLIFSIYFSPHNFISFSEFLGSMGYESDVALGTYRAFYTRQFEYVIPGVFQFTKILPYTLGWPVLILSILGFIFLPYKKEFNILRLAILAAFVPNAFMYAKWTRFVSPMLPLMLVFAVLFIFYFIPLLARASEKMGISKIKKLIWIPAFSVMRILFILPGLAYLSIYQNQDIRFTISEWVYKNIPEGSYVLSETANVVDVPIPNPKKPELKPVDIKYISFDFYHLDENQELASQLAEHLDKAEYIFVPSRRVFANHYCPSPEMLPIAERELNFPLISEGEKEKCQFVRNKYPKLQEYYNNLFSGQSGFQKIAEFSQFPKVQVFGKTILELPDEEAEETWTVFDHPVFRIYKKI